ncbi:MAG: hypothetical protein PHF84_06545 [bacterium]|nr:hypothetical protein [bacterium]
MKKIILTLFILLCAFTGFTGAQSEIIGFTVTSFPFYIYADAFSKDNHFIPSGWMGDVGDIKFQNSCKINPKSGKTCIQIKYSAQNSQKAGWAGIFWQSPANNWGTAKGGYNLTGAARCVFFARGEKGGETVEFKIGGITGDFPDTCSVSSDQIELTREWRKYEISISNENLTYVSGGFCVVFSGTYNPDGCCFYLDDIMFEKNTDFAIKK